jgi:hypothetical protein
VAPVPDGLDRRLASSARGRSEERLLPPPPSTHAPAGASRFPSRSGWGQRKCESRNVGHRCRALRRPAYKAKSRGRNPVCEAAAGFVIQPTSRKHDSCMRSKPPILAAARLCFAGWYLASHTHSLSRTADKDRMSLPCREGSEARRRATGVGCGGVRSRCERSEHARRGSSPSCKASRSEAAAKMDVPRTPHLRSPAPSDRLLRGPGQ